MKKIIFRILVSSVLTCSLFASEIVIKSTGQTKSYNTKGSEVTNGSLKDDGYYQKGKKAYYSRDNKKELVVDHITGLMWQDDERAARVKLPWFSSSGVSAAAYCLDLEHAGYEDWYLPSIEELDSIVDRNKVNGIDEKYFKHVILGSYWSSTRHAQYNTTAWAVNFYLAGMHTQLSKNNKFFIRCVRELK